ncbi:hypothetical protein Pgin03_01058 [Porphyromonas gingivalis]
MSFSQSIQYFCVYTSRRLGNKPMQFRLFRESLRHSLAHHFLFLCDQCSNIFFDRTDTGYTEVFDQHFRYIR